jgi:hypothetical protein
MEIYQMHHVFLAEFFAHKEEDSLKIAEEKVRGEEAGGKHPLNPKEYILEFAKCIDHVRNGEEMETLGIDFPHTGLESDPICRACYQCPTMKDRGEVEELYKTRIKKLP